MIFMRYCESPFFHHRRPTREVTIGDPENGGVIMGGNHPVVKHSMLTCDTMDTQLCVQQTLELVAVGCQIVTGVDMFVRQAAIQFRIWHGADAPEQVMRDALKRATSSARAPD